MANNTITTESDFEELLMELVLEADDTGVSCVQTYEEATLMTMNKGIVVKMENGAEFQVQIVRSSTPDWPRD